MLQENGKHFLRIVFGQQGGLRGFEHTAVFGFCVSSKNDYRCFTFKNGSFNPMTEGDLIYEDVVKLRDFLDKEIKEFEEIKCH
jgi:hypothetical protein